MSIFTRFVEINNRQRRTRGGRHMSRVNDVTSVCHYWEAVDNWEVRSWSAGVLLSDDEWSHQNKEWQETLDLARKFGWSSAKVMSHGGLSLKCPQNVHKIRIFSTGGSTENVARSKRTTIRSCEHRNITDVVNQVELCLTDASRMLGAAEVLTQRAEAVGQMEKAMLMLDEVGEQLSQADAIFDAAGASLDQANAAVEDLVAAEVAAGAKALVGSARSQVREATLTLRDLPPDHERVHALAVRRGELQQRLDNLKARLARGF